MVGCVDWDYDLFQVGILVSYQSSLSQSASTTKSNKKAELKKIKLELVEIKNKYARLSVDLAHMKKVFEGFMIKRTFIDMMSKDSAEK